ncbi:hypothetical protein Pla175_00230 [Pirellulimonas nuda]|uniref:Uncharacterized protein n=1 Tax=Pirellulimonas nuda TaxID=2528009 RepID=A0A518D5D0_9BACT|nr:hypothetical protein [Pirellulimonas nuda]QDU86673.1 hypothetical protein Pla175_00230 [Pirellulimonas nuda]
MTAPSAWFGMEDEAIDDETTLENHPGELPASLALELMVRDRDVIEALSERPSGRARHDYALDALRIGVLALRHAQGRIDAQSVRDEGARLVGELQKLFDQNAQQSHEKTSAVLKDYFDPQSGRLAERVGRLVSDDGELATLLKSHLGGEGSQLGRTLDARIGAGSPLMRLLDPQQAQGVVASLRAVVDGELVKQRESVLREFSLDNKEGALSRLVGELTCKHGDLSRDLKQKIDDVVAEFSLDKEDSALSRLVSNVDRAQRTISSEFSLDNDASALSRLKQMLEATQGAIHGNLTLDDEASPLARLRRELSGLLEQADKRNRDFQENVKVSLAAMVAKRVEAERGTQHGATFEEAVFEFIAREAQHSGDVAAATGASTGLIKNCKKGDCIVELGHESAAPGAKLVVEAKQESGYTLLRACEELAEARKNRGAGFGLFVFSKRCAPATLAPVRRYGQDVVVLWDAEDPTTDVYLRAGLDIARALSIRVGRSQETQAADFDAIEKAINEIEKRSAGLDKVRKPAETIRSSSETILERVRIDQEALERQVVLLRAQLVILREAQAPA